MAQQSSSVSQLPTAAPPAIRVSGGEGGGVRIALAGTWTRAARIPAAGEALAAIAGAPPGSGVEVSAAELGGWDSMLVAFLLRLKDAAGAAKQPVAWEGLPPGVRRLVDLASAVPERTGTGRGGGGTSLLAGIGKWALSMVDGTQATTRFLGQVVIALGAFVRGRAVYRREDLVRTIQETGAQALPIVSVISLLIGLILAFIGAVQLAQFGAAIYVADLVGLAMTREMAAVMTAIVVAGRTGAAFAAQLGTMQGNEEIDALATLGVPPVEFLVLPRMLALALMMPLLYVYGCFIGLFGGYLVGVGMLDLGGQAYVDRTREAVGLADFAIGFVKSAVFGAVVAFAGCQRGIEAGRSAAAVGQATTSAVVNSILYIIIIDAVFSVLLNVLGI